MKEINDKGYFWLPTEQDKPVFGEITSISGSIKLTIYSIYNDDNEFTSLNFLDEETYSIINGVLIEGGRVTILNAQCWACKNSILTVKQFSVEYLIQNDGHIFKKADEIIFSRIAFAYPHIEFFNIDNDGTHNISKNGNSVEWSKSEKRYDIDENLSIIVSFDYNSNREGRRKFQLEKSTLFYVQFNHDITVDSLMINYLKKITLILSMILGYNIIPQNIMLYFNQNKEKREDVLFLHTSLDSDYIEHSHQYIDFSIIDVLFRQYLSNYFHFYCSNDDILGKIKTLYIRDHVLEYKIEIACLSLESLGEKFITNGKYVDKTYYKSTVLPLLKQGIEDISDPSVSEIIKGRIMGQLSTSNDFSFQSKIEYLVQTVIEILDELFTIDFTRLPKRISDVRNGLVHPRENEIITQSNALEYYTLFIVMRCVFDSFVYLQIGMDKAIILKILRIAYETYVKS